MAHRLIRPKARSAAVYHQGKHKGTIELRPRRTRIGSGFGRVNGARPSRAAFVDLPPTEVPRLIAFATHQSPPHPFRKAGTFLVPCFVNPTTIVPTRAAGFGLRGAPRGLKPAAQIVASLVKQNTREPGGKRPSNKLPTTLFNELRTNMPPSSPRCPFSLRISKLPISGLFFSNHDCSHVSTIMLDQVSGKVSLGRTRL